MAMTNFERHMKKFFDSRPFVKDILRGQREDIHCPICSCWNDSVDLNHNDDRCYNCNFMLTDDSEFIAIEEMTI